MSLGRAFGQCLVAPRFASFTQLTLTLRYVPLHLAFHTPEHLILGDKLRTVFAHLLPKCELVIRVEFIDSFHFEPLYLEKPPHVLTVTP